jgi:hypothetical protein
VGSHIVLQAWRREREMDVHAWGLRGRGLAKRCRPEDAAEGDMSVRE